MQNLFDIRYIKLYFKISLLETCTLHANKASAIRGGIGEMLLRSNCVRDRQCEVCDFSSECIVQRMMYSQFDNKPEFMSSGDSVGYVVECENYQKEFRAGDEIEFRLLLFGKTIVYFNQYMQALYALGQYGIGKNHVHFSITEVTNSFSRPILQGNNIYMQYYEIETVEDYIVRRKNQLARDGFHNKLIFKTPLSQKYQGEFLQQFDIQAIVKSIQRRVYMLEAFEGHDVQKWYQSDYDLPILIHQTTRPISVKRFSNRKESAMYLKGIVGEIDLADISDEMLELLLAGELIHIGKNTSFGFGRFILK